MKLSFLRKRDNKTEEDLLVVHFHTVIFEMKNTPLVPEEDTGDPLSHKHAGSYISRSQTLYRPYQQQSQIKHPGCRSKQAKMKVEKMKKAYGMAKEINTSVGTEPQQDTGDEMYQQMIVFSSSLDTGH